MEKMMKIDNQLHELNPDKMITPANWNFCQYILGEDSISISLEAGPETDNFLYLITLRKRDILESEKAFTTLNDACFFINQQYGHYRFIDLTKYQGESKCSTCG